ncbi:13322_t:CDS:1, partial [Ambispora leptoticha]
MSHAAIKIPEPAFTKDKTGSRDSMEECVLKIYDFQNSVQTEQTPPPPIITNRQNKISLFCDESQYDKGLWFSLLFAAIALASFLAFVIVLGQLSK